MKIAIMADSHDNWTNMHEAVELANQAQCQYLLHAGDLIAPPGIAILQKFNGEVHYVWGNNENEKMVITRKMDADPKLHLEGGFFRGELAGLKVFMNHYPEYTEFAAKSGEFDLCIFGHTHEYLHETVGDAILLNPGEVQGYLTGTATFVLFDSETKEVEKVVL